MVAKVILGLKNVQYLSVQAVADNDLSNVWIILNNLICYFLLVYDLSSSCPHLRVLDLRNSPFDDCMADLLCGRKKIIRKGDLYKITAVKKERCQPPLFQQTLVILDLRNSKIGIQGLSTLQNCFNERLKVLKLDLESIGSSLGID